jgi:hypothetical protein
MLKVRIVWWEEVSEAGVLPRGFFKKVGVTERRVRTDAEPVP